jgi:CRISPR type I-E-associated protein CasB/Cse2
MTTSALRPSSRPAAAFIARLRRRLATDTGFAARLRRQAGSLWPRGGRELVDWCGFLDRAPAEFRDKDASIAFLVATLCAHDRRFYRSVRAPGEDEEDAHEVPISELVRGTNLGGTLGRLVRKPKPADDPMARRLAILLDATLDTDSGGTLPWRLRRAVQLILSMDGRSNAIDWVRLLADLQQWSDPKRPVQREWARAFYRLAAVEPDAASPTDVETL